LEDGAIVGASILFTPNPIVSSDNQVNRLGKRVYTECQEVINGTIRVPWDEDVAFPCGNSSSYCLFDTPSGEPDVCVNNVGEPISPFNTSLLESTGSFCCPNGTQACASSLNSDSGSSIIGCANVTAGEECCANQVCPSNSKCCFVPSPPGWDTSPELEYMTYIIPENSTSNPFVTNRCCPEGTYCCAILLPSPTGDDDATEVFTYCGRNENCTSLATMSEVLQPMPSVNFFFPDYIEGQGWLDLAEKRDQAAADITPNTCDCIGETSTNDDPGGDQLQLDLYVRSGTCKEVRP
jgi:hypothetical protein